MVEDGDADLSLCHGIAGNAEVLAAGHGVLTREETAGAEPRSSEPAGLLERAARACGHRISRRRVGWEEDPDDQPGLMLGLAGVGLFLLRLHDPSVPSPLLLRPDALA
jgi:lantibiotic modifying enzyme